MKADKQARLPGILTAAAVAMGLLVASQAHAQPQGEPTPEAAEVIAILDPELPETDDTLWAIAQPMVVQAAREGMGSELILVFDEQAQFLWSVLEAQVNLLSGQMVVTFDVQVEGEEGLILTMSLLEMGDQLSAATSWSDDSILPQQTFHDIVATSSLGQIDPQLSPVVVNAELALLPDSRLFCKCDNDDGSGCKKEDCNYIRPCPNPPPSGIHSCAWTYAS